MKQTEQTCFLSINQEERRNPSSDWACAIFPSLGLIVRLYFLLWFVVDRLKCFSVLRFFFYRTKLYFDPDILYGNTKSIESGSEWLQLLVPHPWEVFEHDRPSVMWSNGEGNNIEEGNISSIKHKNKNKLKSIVRKRIMNLRHFHQTWCCSSRTGSRQRLRTFYVV